MSPTTTDGCRVAQADAPVVANRWLCDRYWSIRLYCPAVAVGAAPGQFVMCSPNPRGLSPFALPRPMAVFATDVDAGEVEVVYGVVGAGTEQLTRFEAGHALQVVGPLGTSFDIPAPGRHLVLFGRGIGVCSLTLLARRAIEAGARVTALVSARHEQAVVGADHLRGLGVPVLVVDDRSRSSRVEEVRRLVSAEVGDAEVTAVATCGSRRLRRLAAETAASWRATMHYAAEAHMACGLGFCHGCVDAASAPAGEALVCRQGPVFAGAVGRPVHVGDRGSPEVAS
jgi:dihydroorotate dehydrogenase electron transfer subunit